MYVGKSPCMVLLLCAGLLAGSQIMAAAQTMYAIGDPFVSGELYQVQNYTSSPVAVPIGDTGLGLTDLAVSPNGTGYAVDFSNLYLVNLATASTTLIHSESVGFNALLAASDTTLYAQSFSDSHLYSLNTTTGAATQLFDTGFFSAGDLAFGPSGTDLYLAATNNHLIRLNLTNSTATDVGAFGVSNIFGLAFVNGVLYAGSDTANLYTVNTSTGSATSVGSISGATTFGLGGLAVSPADAAVPEPGSIALLVGMAVTGAGFLARRHKTHKAA